MTAGHSPDPVLHLLAGPNGSGKSTYASNVLVPVMLLPFINADELAKELWPGEEEAHAYEASQRTAAMRAELLSARTSFITETVFSHPSKVDLIREATQVGYHVRLHVILIPEDTAVARVRQRVSHGGHTVPEEKIRERYARLWSLVAQARDLAERTQIYNNSSARHPFQLIATYDHGTQVGHVDWPGWAPTDLTGKPSTP